MFFSCGGCDVQYLHYNKRVALSVIIIWSFFEPVRLVFGYMGNLKENVRDIKVCTDFTRLKVKVPIIFSGT